MTDEMGLHPIPCLPPALSSSIRITLDVDVSLYDFDAIMDSDIKKNFAHLPKRIQESIHAFLLGVFLDRKLETFLICEGATYKAADALLAYWKEPDSKEFVKPGLEFVGLREGRNSKNTLISM